MSLSKITGNDSFNEREMVGTCFLDISKKFDCIDDKLLLQKLERYGVQNNELIWFSNYLSGRKQTVYCHEKLSNLKESVYWNTPGQCTGSITFSCFY